MKPITKGGAALVTTLLVAGTVAAYKPPVSFQMGPPGLGMEVVTTPAALAERRAANEIPFALPKAAAGGARAVDAYKNVQVLGHLSSGELTRLMTAMTMWVSPDQGCAYCHAPARDTNGVILRNDLGYPLADNNNLQSDELYTKQVARRMLQMTMHVNQDWTAHVQGTGVTCYTCHRGNPVPTNIWFDVPDESTRYQGIPRSGTSFRVSTVADLSSLPTGALRPFLAGNEDIRVQSTVATDSENRSSIKQAEWTYGLMLHMSNSLGVNCTYCHNSRSMGDWSTSPTTRTTAWYGIRMVRDLNHEYLEPLASTFPQERMGPLGDGPKVNCATCHVGAYKPLLGVSMLTDYPELAKAVPPPARTPAVAASAGAIDAAPVDASGTTAGAASAAAAASAASSAASASGLIPGPPATVPAFATSGAPALSAPPRRP